MRAALPLADAQVASDPANPTAVIPNMDRRPILLFLWKRLR